MSAEPVRLRAFSFRRETGCSRRAMPDRVAHRGLVRVKARAGWPALGDGDLAIDARTQRRRGRWRPSRRESDPSVARAGARGGRNGRRFRGAPRGERGRSTVPVPAGATARQARRLRDTDLDRRSTALGRRTFCERQRTRNVAPNESAVFERLGRRRVLRAAERTLGADVGRRRLGAARLGELALFGHHHA